MSGDYSLAEQRRLAAELARLFALARRHWGIPDPPPREPPPPAASMQQTYLADVIELYRAGLAYKQIAAQLGIDPDSVRSIIVEARGAGDWPPDLYRTRRTPNDG